MLALGQSLGVLAGTAVLLGFAVAPRAHSRQKQEAHQATYVGAAACAECHAAVNHEWATSRHSKMTQPATPKSVIGDFARGSVTLRGVPYIFKERNGAFYITGSYLYGRPKEHRVDYTLGSRRIQHYLTTLPDGRIILIPATWDNVRKQWFDNRDIDDPEEAPGVNVQLWNKTCYGCHASQEKKNFNPELAKYETTWLDFGINCERCHGPGSEHIAWAHASPVLDAQARAIINANIVNPTKLDPWRSTMVCAQCHSFRDIYVDDFHAGDNYFDHFLPVMDYRLPKSEDPAYWADGRTRRFSNDAFGLWQSQCFLKGGATCITCHSDAHNTNIDLNPQLKPSNNALCTQCHANIATKLTEHTHHLAKSMGSSCVECHMPQTVLSIKAKIRDHSMSIPVPENTIKHGIPNACTNCHKQQTPQWAARQMDTWWGRNSASRQKLIERADAFTEAHAGDPTAIPALLRILNDPSGGPLIRGNAAGFLAGYRDNPEAYRAVFGAMRDPDPLVRAVAALSIQPIADQRMAVANELVPMLRDDVAVVRMTAGIALVAMGFKELPGADGESLKQAIQLYRARAELNDDDAEQQLAAGKFYFFSGDYARSVDAFRATMKLDPEMQAQYYLGRALAANGEYSAARAVLQAVPSSSPQYAISQRVIAEIELKEDTAPAGAAASDAAAAADPKSRFLNAEIQYQSGEYAPALENLNAALTLAPQADWAIKAQIYRAICLEKLGRGAEAEKAMAPLADSGASANDLDLQLAYAELLSDSGRNEDALKRVDRALSVHPGAAVALFWRAKVLMQLKQPEEAAKAAEQAVRLQPEFASAHNLLVRIYQLEGRTKEAAQQAEWLRDYQRRTGAH